MTCLRPRINRVFLLTLLGLIGLIIPSFAQKDNNNNYLDSSKNWSLHYQFTTIVQGHTGFKGAGYSGRNTLSDLPDTTLSVTTTLFIGRKLWKGGSLFLNPEIAGGRGVGRRDPTNPYDETLYNPAVGIAGFPNGETFRIGSSKPGLYVARFYVEQVFALPGAKPENIDSEANKVKQQRPDSRVVITAGKFSIADIFDNNAYSHDPRTQFMNWSLMSYGAWDYPANTRGYTWGLAVEYVRPAYELRVAYNLMPKTANGNVLDWNIAQSGGLTMELESRYHLLKKPGTVRFLAFRNVTKAPTYTDAIQKLMDGSNDPQRPYISNGERYGGVKYGFGLSLEQPIAQNSGLFARASWNDGKTATWAFTEIDQSVSAGAFIAGSRWGRPEDAIGVAGVMNGLSSGHAAFLNAGGTGFMLGDGKLPNYRPEQILEVFYKTRLTHTLFITADYQLVGNPGYNGDRGPVNLFGVRTHVEF
ncbi:carbohydrate porin [Fibrella sp. HMF5335]|uniref:Carbohydrate porin n=1 Tax=Fibrella rubiginis TaxID=2817060 RepID=A0A939GGV4_9BACT|nr:carbohydrate porin [Fibrella rubiginis]MBO0938101.1 carbohydrate porin [Fibrella rubiginis]